MRKLLIALGLIFYPVKRRILLTTKTDRTFRGILWKAYPSYMILKDASILGPENRSTHLDGEVTIYRVDVDFIQVEP